MMIERVKSKCSRHIRRPGPVTARGIFHLRLAHFRPCPEPRVVSDFIV